MLLTWTPPRARRLGHLSRMLGLGLGWSALALAQGGADPPEAADSPSVPGPADPTAPTTDEARGEGQAPATATPEPPPSNPDKDSPGDSRARAPVSAQVTAQLSAWAAQQTPSCKVQAIAGQGGHYFLACGADGLWRVKARAETEPASGGRTERADSYTLVSREYRGGAVVGFARVNDALVILVDLRVVQPLDEREQLVSASVAFVDEDVAPPSTPEEDGPIGTVVGGGGLKVTLELDPDHQLGVGYRVQFRWGSQHVVGRVVRIDGPRAVVMIGLHEPRPPKGTRAESTPERSTSRVMAPRDGDYHYSIDLGVRLGLSRDGIFGAEGGVQARFGSLTFGGEVRPFVFSLLGIEVVQAFVSFGIATTWLGFTFGGGTSTVNMHDGNPPGTGVLLSPAVRIGTIDGLRLDVRASTTFHRQEMHFTGFFANAQIPVSRSVAVLAGGGGGDLGLAEGEVGMRTLIQGNGSAKSWFLRTSAGATFLQQSFTSIAAAPHIRVVVETRL